MSYRITFPPRRKCKRCHAHKDMAGGGNMGSTRVWWCKDCRAKPVVSARQYVAEKQQESVA